MVVVWTVGVGAAQAGGLAVAWAEVSVNTGAETAGAVRGVEASVVQTEGREMAAAREAAVRAGAETAMERALRAAVEAQMAPAELGRGGLLSKHSKDPMEYQTPI